MDAALKPLLSMPVLDADRLAQLARLTEDLAPVELYWIAAYSAALASEADSLSTGESSVAVSASTKVGDRLSIVYGSQTGNSRRVAEQFAQQAEATGVTVRLLRAGAYPLRELASESRLLVVISSQGDGDPPDDALGFVEFVAGRRAPRLPQLRFAVLGLGDSSYPKFCAVSRALDARLTELGASRFVEAGEADVDFEAVAKVWSLNALAAVRESCDVLPPPARPLTALHAVTNLPVHTREQPFAATVLENQRIVSRDSERDVRHVELSLEGSGLSYMPGDALGVWPRNPPELVRQWLALLQLDGSREIEHAGRRLPLSRWLGEERELTRLTRGFAAAHAARATTHADELRHALEAGHQVALATLFGSHQPIDLLHRFPANWDADELVAALRPLTPRLYSIASSASTVGRDEVHLTVGVVQYAAHGSTHMGAASMFLAGAGTDAKIPVFIESNERFRLPVDGGRDIIMIGPGTGVAPFRAFVQERRASAASGRNWLFFGNRHFRQDFLYQVEWQEALRSGALHRLDLAFSRDAAKKIYVQQRIREHGRELYAWLREGAHIYVCGDSTHMARDVNDALLEVIAIHGGLSVDDAKAWLAELLQEGRYARDVY